MADGAQSGASFAYQGSVDNLPSVSLTTSKKQAKPKMSLEVLLTKKDKIAALPPEVRDQVIDRIYDKFVAPKIPKSVGDDQKVIIKQHLSDTFSGKAVQQIQPQAKESDYQKEGFLTNALGKFEEGFGKGSANLLHLLNAISFKKGSETERGRWEGTENSLRSGISGHEKSTEEYTKSHPYSAGISSFAGQLAPSIPLTMTGEGMIPSVAKGAPLLSKLLSNIGKGAIGGGLSNLSFDPSTEGFEQGAGYGAGTAGLLTGLKGGLGKVIKRTPKITAKVASEAVAGASDDAAAKLDALANKSYGKKLSELTPEQKIKVVNDWRDSTVTEQKAARETAKKAAEAAKVEKAKANAAASTDSKVQVRRAMDEAKALQKQIAAFAKNNKRAPTDEELVGLREKAKAAPTVEAPKATPETKPKYTGPERRATPRPDPQSMEDFRKAEIPRLRRLIASETDPAHKRILEQQLQVAQQPLAEQFKIENPEVVKAVAAVADVSKTTALESSPVVKVPEGEHGTGALGKRAKDAERVAKARELAKATQPEPATPETPETELMKKEEEFLNLTDQIEAMGPKGKEAAKNLDLFRRKGKITLDDAIMMGGKVLETFQKGKGPK